MPILSSSIPAPARKLIPFPTLAAASPARLPQLPRPALLRAEAPARPAARVEDGQALAHDARNALATLQLLNGLLAEPGALSAGHQGLAGDLAEVSGRLNALIGEMERRLQRRTAPLPIAGPQAASANLALEQAQRVLTLTAGSKVQLHVSAESGLPALAMADSVLERVLVNLVKNAAEAMPEGGSVRITARRALSRTAPAVLLHISDDGPGIPAHALDHIFKPGFSSKRNARPWQVECGLGLAIVRQLLEAAGGSIEVASTRRRGTTFELRIPVQPAQA